MDTFIFVVSVGLVFFLMTCWAIIDVAQKDFGSPEKKIVWGIIAWLPFFGYKKGKRPLKVRDV